MKIQRKVQAIIYDIKNNKPRFLIFRRILRWRGWELCKETIEKGETPYQTLLRGLKEETGFKKIRSIKRLAIRRQWKINHVLYKIVESYLVHATMNEKTSLDRAEHSSCRWITKNHLLKLLTHKDQKTFFQRVYRNVFK